MTLEPPARAKHRDLPSLETLARAKRKDLLNLETLARAKPRVSFPCATSIARQAVERSALETARQERENHRQKGVDPRLT